jgi:hypothetical protein
MGRYGLTNVASGRMEREAEMYEKITVFQQLQPDCWLSLSILIGSG